MKPFNRISQRINSLTPEQLYVGNRAIDFRPIHPTLWKGVKRYAH